MSSEQANLHREKLDKLLSHEGIEAIYNLANWLNNLGLKLTVSVSEETEDSSINTASQSELTV
jgi:DNA-binding phage protein